MPVVKLIVFFKYVSVGYLHYTDRNRIWRSLP